MTKAHSAPGLTKQERATRQRFLSPAPRSGAYKVIQLGVRDQA